MKARGEPYLPYITVAYIVVIRPLTWLTKEHSAQKYVSRNELCQYSGQKLYARSVSDPKLWQQRLKLPMRKLLKVKTWKHIS